MERKGPHKSMHCKFCKPPGNVAPEKPGPPQVETKTKLHLSHQVADLKILDIFDEPGEIEEETDVCICQLEGYEPCPKCAPDKKRKAIIKKVCDCPLGAKPKQNVTNLDRAKVKIKKKKVDDDEFWWEKYNRERDAVVKETWAAYLAQRKQDKKLIKCREKGGNNNLSSLLKPMWYQKLSCQQTIYLEYLSTAIRLDLDEKITDRTCFVLGGIGFYPRPKRKMLEKCLRYCHYNTIRFLNQLSLLFQEEDPFKERVPDRNIPLARQDLYAWNDRILMGCICYLEFPKLLREIMDRLPPMPQEQVPPPIPIPRYPRVGFKQYDSPYDEPVWRERINWLEEQKIMRINRAREHLNKKRMEIPSLALMRRPSLIDARPTFLSQIEASRSFQRRKRPAMMKTKMLRKKGKPTFDSKVDVTAIAGIEASEVSTTPKAGSEEICVFLREKESELSYEEDEDEEQQEEEEQEEQQVKFEEEYITAQDKEPEISRDRDPVCEVSSNRKESGPVEEVSDDGDDIPFVTPPKNESGTTVERCLPPKGSPGPPASHYDVAKRELGLVNQDLCVFDPNDCKSINEDESFDETFLNMNVEYQLKEVAKKLRALHLGDEDYGEEDEEEEEGEEEMKIGKQSRERSVKKKRGKRKCKETKKNKKSKRGKEDNKNSGLDETGYNKELENMIFIEHDSQASAKNEENDRANEPGEVCLCARDEQNETKMKRKKGKKGKKRKKGKKENGTKKKKTIKETWSPCQPGKDETEKTENYSTGLDEEPDRIQDGVTEQEGRVVATGESDKKTISTNDSVSEDKIFYGDVQPLLKTILKDLSDEGFISAGYAQIEEHPDIKKLIRHLKGEIVGANTKKRLHLITKDYWRILKKQKNKFAPLPDLNISLRRLEKATWNDKNWISSLTKRKKEEFYFKIAKNRASEARDFYLTLFQEYFGTERFLNSYYAYMIPARKESIMRGLTK